MKTKSIISHLFLLFSVVLFGVNSNAQDFKNELRFRTLGGISNLGFDVEYARDLTDNIAVVATVGYHEIERDLDDLRCSDILSNYSRFGLGVEFRPMGEPKGFFVQANAVLRMVSNEFKAKIFENPENFADCQFNIFDIFSVDAVDSYFVRDEYNSFGVSGKIGYRLMTKNERFTFTPFVNFESSPIKNETVTAPFDLLTSFTSYDPIETVDLNASEETKLMQLRFGFDFGVRF